MSATTEITLVDSNVLLDIFTDDDTWAEWSTTNLSRAFDTGKVVINPIIYSEVSVGFKTVEELDHLLPTDHFHREPLPWEAGFLAGKAFLDYRRRGGKRRSPLPDFYIGAHAAVSGYRLLTRDKGRYTTSFPSLTLIIP